MQKTQTLIPYLRPASERTNSILPNTVDFVEDHKFLTNWETVEYQGWKLPAISDPHWWCGMFTTLGCLNKEAHQKLGKGNMIYIKRFQCSCYRAVCKICYLKWIARQSNNATRRIEAYTNKSDRQPLHLILIVNPNQYDLPVKVLRQRMSHILKGAEIEGAAVVFHPFRFSHEKRQFYPAPHFHLIGFGSEEKIRQVFGKYGWYVKNEGERRSVFQTFCYVLSHCGVKKGYQTVTWFGSLSYSKLPVEKELKITSCPVCGGEFEEIYYAELFHPVVP
ncbi:MAG: hypothetical protein QXG67_02870, partial [Candidatus Nitrosotenuis sp.]